MTESRDCATFLNFISTDTLLEKSWSLSLLSFSKKILGNFNCNFSWSWIFLTILNILFQIISFDNRKSMNWLGFPLRYSSLMFTIEVLRCTLILLELTTWHNSLRKKCLIEICLYQEMWKVTQIKIHWLLQVWFVVSHQMSRKRQKSTYVM